MWVAFEALRKQRLAARLSHARTQHKINCITSRIDCPIQILPPAFHVDVSLIHSSRIVSWLQVRTAPFSGSGAEGKHPSIYSCMVNF
ncbi:MAG: hypothetical protein CLLPBCKN_000921 [Chroococcidiopsis cubana SAG 39.79]|nr:hypothetical protein [Chroococcidiopsis cubana SAG 39.79]